MVKYAENTNVMLIQKEGEMVNNTECERYKTYSTNY